jgi:SpoVK/Ycf46/Vps4 family AAA+-type ATPase
VGAVEVVSDRATALRAAVEADPENHVLRVMLAEALEQAGRNAEALAEYETLLGKGGLGGDEALRGARLAVGGERADLARGLLEHARQEGVVEGVPEAEAALAELLERRGLQRVPVDPAGGSRTWSVEPAALTFADVGGLAEVKKILHRLVVLPLSRPELYERYGRRAGGGVLLYGPPGCGKTMLARGLAGECGLPFLVVRIEQVLDPFFGVSERNLHDAFEAARDAAPCVLFLDELDAIAYARFKSVGESGRRLVDVLLQELDSIGSDNTGILVLAATNAPWDVDDAAQRPGRFDRRVFVPPPDEAARSQVLSVLLRDVHAADIDIRRLAKSTELFSGADLRAVVERAVDEVIDDALASGNEPPLTQEHLVRATSSVRPTTLDWLQRAKDHVEFAGASEKYVDVAAYLKAKDVRKRLGGY